MSSPVNRLKAMLANNPRNGTPVPADCVLDADSVLNLDAAIKARQQKAFLDIAWAALCTPVVRYDAADYEDRQAWAIELEAKYANCAARHRKTVEASPK